MIFYGSSLSPFVRKVLAFAGEKGIELELQADRRSPDSRAPEFLEASPFRKMPAFRDGDFTLADFERDHPLSRSETSRAGADPGAIRKLRGKTIWFEEFADTILVACGAKIFFNRIVAPRFPGPAGRRGGSAAGRDQRSAADPRLSRADVCPATAAIWSVTG